MQKNERSKIKSMAICDFSNIKEYQREEAENTREKYGYCLVDGNREKIGNFKIEPPGLFFGRGNHPKTGTVKNRVLPEHVTINCSEGNEPGLHHGLKTCKINQSTFS